MLARLFLWLLFVAVLVSGVPRLVVAADGDEQVQRELRSIKRAISRLNQRVQDLEERIARAADSAAPKPNLDGANRLFWPALGIRLGTLNADTKALKASRYRGGMLVAEIREGGPAAKAGVRAGDILVGVHVWETTDFDDVRYVVNSKPFREAKPLKFFVLRNGNTLFGRFTPD